MSIVADVAASTSFFWLARADISVGWPQPFNILSLVRLCFDDSVMSHFCSLLRSGVVFDQEAIRKEKWSAPGLIEFHSCRLWH